MHFVLVEKVKQKYSCYRLKEVVSVVSVEFALWIGNLGCLACVYKSGDLFWCVMNLEKLIMDKENQNKTDVQEGVWKLFYQHYCDLLRQWKAVKVVLENTIAFKTFLSLFFGYLYKNGREGICFGKNGHIWKKATL